MPISGGIKVKTMNKMAIMPSIASANVGFEQKAFCRLNNRISWIYAIAAEMKKIAILIQSGDFPMTPL